MEEQLIVAPPKFIFRGDNQPLGGYDGEIMYNENDNKLQIFYSNGWHNLLTNHFQSYENIPI